MVLTYSSVLVYVMMDTLMSIQQMVSIDSPVTVPEKHAAKHIRIIELAATLGLI